MIITVTGPNDFARSRAISLLVADFLIEYGDLALERLDGEEVSFEKLQEALQSLPFLAARKLVVLRTPSANKQFIEVSEQLFQELPETTDLILLEPKLDKRLAYYKWLKKHTDFREFNELDNSGLVKWLSDEAKRQKGSLGPAEARFLIDRVGANQQLLANELDKLLLFNPDITRETIEAMTDQTPQSTIFELLDASFAGNTKRSLQLYAEQRALKIEPQQIIALLGWQFHVLATIKTAGQRTPEQIASEAKLNPYVVRKSLPVARQLTLNEVRRLVRELAVLDVRLKSEGIDSDEALQYFLLSLHATVERQ